MADFFSQDNIDQFRGAMRDLTDTFHKNPVILRKVSGAETELLAGLKPVETGEDGEVTGERYIQEERQETVERWIVTFNRDYLKEKLLVSDDVLLINDDDWIIINEKRHSIVKLSDKGMFCGFPILVQLTVAR